jgi:SAM-dependent methyltransferase
MATWGEYYHGIAKDLAFYTASNRRMVELAGLRPGMRVLDLACGSGLTAEAALAAVPEGLELHLLDVDPSMIEVARARLGDRVTGYHVADAAQVGELAAAGAFGGRGASTGPVALGQPSAAGGPIPPVHGQGATPLFDRVLCNLALFSFRDPEAVLRALKPLVKPAGRLLFSLSGTHFNAGGDIVSPLWALQAALAARGELDRAPTPPERLPNQRAIEGNLQGTGWKPIAYEVQPIPGGEEELAGQLRLYPLPLADGFRQAVDRSLERAAALRIEIEAHRPEWRVVHFQAQPMIDPMQALLMKANQLGHQR